MLVWRVEDRFRKEAVAGVVAYTSTVNITACWDSGNRYNSKVSEKSRDGAKGIPDFKLGCFTSPISALLRVLCVKFWIVRATEQPWTGKGSGFGRFLYRCGLILEKSTAGVGTLAEKVTPLIVLGLYLSENLHSISWIFVTIVLGQKAGDEVLAAVVWLTRWVFAAWSL